MKPPPWVVLVVVAVLLLGTLVGWEVREADAPGGGWQVIRRGFVFPGGPSVADVLADEWQHHGDVRIKRWWCYGLWSGDEIDTSGLELAVDGPLIIHRIDSAD